MSSPYAPHGYYSAPEVYHKPEYVPLEVLPSKSPEVAYDPRAYPPEIASTNAPETVHGPQDFPPEAVFNQYPDDKGKGWEPDSASFQNLVLEKKPKREGLFKRHWKLIILFVLLVVAGAVGGGVGGVLASKSKSKSASSSSGPENSPNSPAQPVDEPSSLSSLTTGLPAGAPKLLQDAPFAATTCADGDRWLFTQDVSGNIRAAQYSNSNSSWRFAPEQHNFTAAKPGTSMRASCVNITEDVGLDLGTYLSLVYISPSDTIEQTVLSGGKWKDSPVRQFSKLPTDGSRLSLSTYFQPMPLHDEPITQESNPPPKVSPRSFSSVVTYQNNATLFTIDLDPRLDSNQDSRSNKNLLANFKGTEDVNYEENIGFACDYNLPIPGNSTHFYTRCFMGNSRGIPQTSNEDVAVRIFDYTWEYPVAEAFTRSNKKYDYVPAIDESFPDVYGIQPFGTDIILAPLAEDKIAIVWLAAAHKVVASGIEPYHNANTSGLAPQEEPLWSKVFSSGQFGATSPRSKTVYVYYQANATAVGEITYDVDRMLWAEDPSFLLIT